MFDLSAIQRDSFIRKAEYVPVLDSTNNRALDLAAEENAELPYLILAGEQTAGRGRGANRWWTGAGALAWSVVLDAESLGLTPENWPRVSLTAALAVCETIKHLAPGAACGIKWPNDVLVGGKKICGVLPELPRFVSHGRPLPRRIVLGVGVNVNNPLHEAPPEVASLATSLMDLTGRTHDLNDVLLKILARLERHLTALSEADPNLSEAWAERCLLRGRTVEILQGDRRIRGTCGGIADDGGLWLDPGDGPCRYYSGIVANVS